MTGGPHGTDRQVPIGSQPPAAPLWLLALMTFSGTLAMHIFVPALPIAAEGLHAKPGTMQLTVSLYIVGLAVGQLFYGPLSDRFGRRPVLMGGLALYAAAGLAAALAPNALMLIAARLLQAFGGCAGLVLGRAIVRDTALPQETALAAVAVLIARAIEAEPGLARGLRREAPITVLTTHSPHFVEMAKEVGRERAGSSTARSVAHRCARERSRVGVPCVEYRHCLGDLDTYERRVVRIPERPLRCRDVRPPAARDGRSSGRPGGRTAGPRRCQHRLGDEP